MKFKRFSISNLTTQLFIFSIALSLSGCGLLIGNVKPVDEKSRQYAVTDLAVSQPLVWKKLSQEQSTAPDSPAEAKGASKDAYSSEISDVAFQSKKNASIVSLNTACRSARVLNQSLQATTRELLLGMGQISDRREKSVTVDGVEGLETTIEGQMSGQATKIRAVVLKKEACVYDLMYIARPDQFPVHELDFAQFVSSLKLR